MEGQSFIEHAFASSTCVAVRMKEADDSSSPVDLFVNAEGCEELASASAVSAPYPAQSFVGHLH